MFVNLPDNTLSDVFAVWTNLRDFAKFDSSLTNSKSRHCLLHLLSSSPQLFIADEYELTPSLSKWLSLRHITVSSLLISSKNFNYAEAKDIVCMNIYTIRIRHDSNFRKFKSLSKFINSCPKLTTLIQFNFSNSEDFWIKLFPLINKDILKQLTDLKNIYARECGIVAEYCRNLKTINWTGGADVFNTLAKLLNNNVNATVFRTEMLFHANTFNTIITAAPHLQFLQFDSYYYGQVTDILSAANITSISLRKNNPHYDGTFDLYNHTLTMYVADPLKFLLELYTVNTALHMTTWSFHGFDIDAEKLCEVMEKAVNVNIQIVNGDCKLTEEVCKRVAVLESQRYCKIAINVIQCDEEVL